MFPSNQPGIIVVISKLTTNILVRNLAPYQAGAATAAWMSNARRQKDGSDDPQVETSWFSDAFDLLCAKSILDYERETAPIPCFRAIWHARPCRDVSYLPTKAKVCQEFHKRCVGWAYEVRQRTRLFLVTLSRTRAPYPASITARPGHEEVFRVLELPHLVIVS